MNQIRTIIVTSCMSLCVFLLPGCESAQPVKKAELPALQPSGNTASPEQNTKAVRWQHAIAGIEIDSRRLLVRPKGTDDRRAGWRHYGEAMQMLQRNDFVGAIGLFRDALENWGDFPEAYDGMGDALRGKGQTEWSIAAYKSALDRKPANTEIRFKMAMGLWAIDQQDEAISEMNLVLEFDSQIAQAHERLAVWNYYVGEYATAWHHVYTARELGGNVPRQFLPLLEHHMRDPRGTIGRNG